MTGAVPDRHPCLFCGEPIEPTEIDPCTAVFAASGREDPLEAKRRGSRSSPWWRRPPGQYWVHAACLRSAAHPTVPLYFLDLTERE